MREIWERIWADIRNLWAAAVAFIVYDILMNMIFHAFCPMVIATGLPCPGCGMTRALLYLAMGKVAKSVQMHPMGIPVACILIYFLWNRYIIGRNAKGIKLLIGIAVALMVLLYVWRMYAFFPERVPYVYAERNMLARIFPIYEQILSEFNIL